MSFFVPFIICIQILFTLGIAFFGSAVIVFLETFRYIVPLGLQLWMFATPVVYPTNLVPAKYLSMYMESYGRYYGFLSTGYFVQESALILNIWVRPLLYP